MKSIKPGRGPSMMSGFGGIFAIIFSIGWTVIAVSMGAPIIFPIFGLCFVALATTTTIYNFKNAKGKNRYSSFDIVDSREEPDPLNEKYSVKDRSDEGGRTNFCPYCGTPVKDDHNFCENCGAKLK